MSETAQMVDINVNVSASRDEIDDAKIVIGALLATWTETGGQPSAMIAAMCETLGELTQQEQPPAEGMN